MVDDPAGVPNKKAQDKKVKPKKFDPASRIHQRKAPHGIKQPGDKLKKGESGVKSYAHISGDTRGNAAKGDNPKGFSATIPLLADRPLSWSLTEGVHPFRARFSFRPEDIETMEKLAEAGPVTLTIVCNNQTVKAENLWITDMPGSSVPHIASVVLSDRRCWWSYGHMKRLYNVMRPVGVKRLKDIDGLLEQMQQRVKKFRYLLGSLKPPGVGGKPWKAREIVEDILTAEDGILQIETQRRRGKKAEVNLKALEGQRTIMPIFDFEIDASSEVALAKALQQIPGAGITVDLDGTIRVFRRFVDLNVDQNRADKQKRGNTLEMLGPEIVGEGHHEFVENKYLRPRQIEVFFTCEAELRFDYGEAASYTTSPSIGGPGTGVPGGGGTFVVQPGATGLDKIGDGMLVETVLPVPDYELKGVVERGSAPFTAVQGTWISIDAALAAWNDHEKNGAFYFGEDNPLKKAGLKLDHDFLQRAFPAYVDLWTGLMSIGMAVEGANWPARIAMLKKHYRQTWRINYQWMNKISSMRARRVAILDFGSGTRGPSPVWTDYAVKATQRSFFKNRNESELYKNVLGGITPKQRITDKLTTSPVNLAILDHDQGIISTQFVGDVYGVDGEYIPGLMEPNLNGNYSVMNQKTGKIFANAAKDTSGAASGVPRMAPEYRSTFIISAVPAEPNSNNQLYKLTVTPGTVKAAKLLPKDLERGLTKCYGPPLQLRVGAGVEVARIAWSDVKRRSIEMLFGMHGGHKAGVENNMDDLIINLGEEGKPWAGDGGASMWDIATGLAATTYAAYADTWVGTAAGHMNPHVKMGGFTESVKFELRPDGQGLTVLNVSAKPVTMPFTMFLGQSTRNILSRLPQAL